MSFRLAWVTDPHFDHASVGAITAHVASLHGEAPDAVLVTGDFATAASLPRWLRAYRRMVECPVYFILGNHDFWGGSVAEGREAALRAASGLEGLTYLTRAEPVTLTPGVALVGHDGWYDARAGRWQEARFRMQDWELVAEYAGKGSHADVVSASRALADAGREELVPKVAAAARGHATVLVATHVPPWPRAVGTGRHPDGLWIAPWYVAQGLGEDLERVAAAHPAVEFRVFAGHDHARRPGMTIAPNLTCHVGRARYGHPVVERVMELGER